MHKPLTLNLKACNRHFYPIYHYTIKARKKILILAKIFKGYDYSRLDGPNDPSNLPQT